MFTIQCTTCGAKLAVRNDELVGQILACPKCGGMVLVKRPEGEPIDLALAEESAENSQLPPPKFPDPATYETDSGIMQPDEVEAIMTAQRQPPPLLAEAELRTRKILLGVLVGLLLLLVLAVGGLIAVKGSAKDHRSKSSQGPEAIAVDRPVVPDEAPKPMEPVAEPAAEPEEAKPEPPEPVAVPLEPPGEKEEDKEEKRDLLAKLLAQTPKPSDEDTMAEPEPKTESDETTAPTEPVAVGRSTNDLLSSLERKMPGLLRPDEMVSVDIPARLSMPLTELKLDGTPLLSFLRAFTGWTEIPVTLDINELRCRGIRVDTPLTEQFGAGTVGDTLTKTLAKLDLEPVIEDRQILVTVPEGRRRGLQEETFDVSDFVERTEETPEYRLNAERLAEILRRLVDPVGFSERQPKDDQPSLRVEGNTLVVRHRYRMLDESLRVLEQLRVIRGLPQTKENITGKHLAPEAFAWDEMVKPMTLNYYQPTPLAGILTQLEEKTTLKILVDHRALHRALCPLSTMRATVRCNRGTVNEALENLLASVDVATLTYRIIDYDVLEITTAYAARQPENMSIEVHRYETPEKPLTGDETPEDLVRTIRSALEPDSWHKPDDPETLGGGEIVIDKPTGCLIVRQSQPVQRQLRLWLGKKLAVETPEE